MVARRFTNPILAREWLVSCPRPITTHLTLFMSNISLYVEPNLPTLGPRGLPSRMPSRESAAATSFIANRGQYHDQSGNGLSRSAESCVLVQKCTGEGIATLQPARHTIGRRLVPTYQTPGISRYFTRALYPA